MSGPTKLDFREAACLIEEKGWWPGEIREPDHVRPTLDAIQALCVVRNRLFEDREFAKALIAFNDTHTEAEVLSLLLGLSEEVPP